MFQKIGDDDDLGNCQWTAEEYLDKIAREFDEVASQLEDEGAAEAQEEMFSERACRTRRMAFLMWGIGGTGTLLTLWLTPTILEVALAAAVAVLCHLRAMDYRTMANHYRAVAKRWKAREARRQRQLNCEDGGKADGEN